MVDELVPADDEIVFPKTSSSVFISTNIDYVLRNLGTKYLIIAGCLTDQWRPTPRWRERGAISAIS